MKRADQVGDAPALVGGEAGERLVEQEQLRTRGERDRDLEQPLIAVREVGRDGEGLVGRARPRRRGGGPRRSGPRTLAASAQHGEAAAVLRLRGDAHVLEDGQRVEDADDLEGAGDAARDDLVRGAAR